MSMSQQAHRLARKMDVDIHDDSLGNIPDITLYAPDGMRFVATGCHTASAGWGFGTKKDAWSAVLAYLRDGLVSDWKPANPYPCPKLSE